ncbi:hypothetical protein RAH32_09045 [Paracoccus sp. WLY502]|uniref:hypothetical protein n=1 Tax=Paracoccus yibinensis TaxID=3068891 RepID=UPI0027965CE6|nr:hypothetical protein [Paracoccus sp. WLY502]MDQ1900590.1 hypothetical protein [Paracoccus sp. WLY502]
MHLKTLIDLIAEQAAREAAKRTTGDAPGAVRPGYGYLPRRAIAFLMKIVAVMARPDCHGPPSPTQRGTFDHGLRP